MPDYQAVTWHTLSPDQVRGGGMNIVAQLEYLKLGHVLELAQLDALRSKLDAEVETDKAEFDQLTTMMRTNQASIDTYDVRIAAVLGAIPPEAANP